jgi:hypothetical protein
LETTRTSLRWRLGVWAALAITLLAIYPQLSLLRARRSDWNGTPVTFDFDEAAYSAYLNALIEGRPRRNDPYTGRDDQPDSPQPESLFSIQFLPPYALAIPARLFGLSASTMFVALMPVAAFASALALFWLIGAVTGDDRIAVIGALIVLCLSGLTRSWTALWMFLKLHPAYYSLLFLRRYTPAMAFPFFFLFCALIWQALNSKAQRAAYLSAIAAGLTFAILVYSYFYLWTAAAAWLCCLAILSAITRSENWHRRMSLFGTVFALASASLVPYAVLLSHRATTMDSAQLLKLSHAPDVSHPSELFAALALGALIIGAWRGIVRWKNDDALFAASFALLPIVVFNQQIVTGHSLQPIHYDRYIANYAALLSVVLTLTLVWRGRTNLRWRIPNYALICLALAVFGWGLLETRRVIRTWLQTNVAIDEQRPILQRLSKLGHDPTNDSPDTRSVVLCTDLIQADNLSTVAPQPVLWAQHMFVFSGAAAVENRQRLYQYLYYTGVDRKEFEALASQSSYLRLMLFGWERYWPNAVQGAELITQEELQQESNNYSGYIATFNRERATEPLLSYLVTPTQGGANISNLDRWYERDTGEQVSGFTIYHLTLRP